jgi:predicted GNAT superfamily acetyltransferase
VGPGTQYWSANYDWVSNRFDSFIYLDRVCVAPPAQRRGIGKALYEQVEHANAAEWFVLEVNTRPLNQPSLDFHAALGFEEVGRAEPYGDGHEVAYLAKRIGQA